MLTDKDKKGIQWLDNRCGELVTDMKVRRKYQPSGNLSPIEAERLSALFEARDALQKLKGVL